MNNFARLSVVLLLVFGGSLLAAEKAPPSSVFDLGRWKLQIPGPKDVKELKGYASDYFYLNADKEMCFHLDASEQGTTPNAKYVRSELRHLPEWGVNTAHALSGEFRVVSALKPDKVTAMQIHGITPDGGNAPPLLRIAVNAGDLVAAFMADNTGKKNEMVTLVKQLGSRFVKVEIAVREKQLTVTVDGEAKLTRKLDFWTHGNYFKAGCYPQATQGTADVFFRSLHAE